MRNCSFTQIVERAAATGRALVDDVGRVRSASLAMSLLMLESRRCIASSESTTLLTWRRLDRRVGRAH